ncbi:type II secretion system protein [Candidatus Gottesmanbacteria bacterium]|nr:type II secretion system protein [Candidatus Gottesmanbacteria bacterium]
MLLCSNRHSGKRSASRIRFWTSQNDSRKAPGYTLIEILIVFSIIGLVSVFGLNFLTTILRGNSKTAVTTEIKQNGNYALDIISYFIRNALSIDNCSASSLSLRQWDNSIVTFLLLPQVDAVSSRLNARIASNSSVLTNADATNGVSVSGLSFTCTNTSPPVVSIGFQVSQSAFLPDRPELKGMVNFQTSVSLRTY